VRAARSTNPFGMIMIAFALVIAFGYRAEL